MIDNKDSGVYIDLFSGCGGFSLGLGRAGWKGLFTVEKDKMAFDTFRHNLIDGPDGHFDWPQWLPVEPMTIQDLLSEHSKDLKKLKGSVDLIVGGPPCQGFSMAGQRDSKDPRNKMSDEYLKVVKLVRPRYIMLENVSGFNSVFKGQKGQAGKIPYAMIVKQKLENLGYSVYYDYIHTEEFGVPQKRKRFLMIGVLNTPQNKNKESPFDLLDTLRERFLTDKQLPSRPVTVREAISDLELSGEGAELSVHSVLRGKEFKELVYRAPSSRNAFQVQMRKGFNGGKALTSMRLANHREQTIEKFKQIKEIGRPGVNLTDEERASLGMKKQVICVLDEDAPSKTITTLPDDLLHYREPRILTVRENARIQSFPDTFEFKGRYTTGGKRRTRECPRYTQVGNAVPPFISEVLGDLITEFDNVQ